MHSTPRTVTQTKFSASDLCKWAARPDMQQAATRWQSALRPEHGDGDLDVPPTRRVMFAWSGYMRLNSLPLVSCGGNSDAALSSGRQGALVPWRVRRRRCTLIHPSADGNDETIVTSIPTLPSESTWLVMGKLYLLLQSERPVSKRAVEYSLRYKLSQSQSRERLPARDNLCVTSTSVQHGPSSPALYGTLKFITAQQNITISSIRWIQSTNSYVILIL